MLRLFLRFRNRAFPCSSDENIPRLYIAVNDALLVRVFNGLTDFDKQLQAGASAEWVLMTTLIDARAIDKF